jgi:hypothetical protein
LLNLDLDAFRRLKIDLPCGTRPPRISCHCTNFRRKKVLPGFALLAVLLRMQRRSFDRPSVFTVLSHMLPRQPLTKPPSEHNEHPHSITSGLSLAIPATIRPSQRQRLGRLRHRTPVAFTAFSPSRLVTASMMDPKYSMSRSAGRARSSAG